MLITLGLTPMSYATEDQCRAVLKDCDAAVKDLQKENALQAQIIKDEDDRFATQTKELNSEQFWKPIAIAGVSLAILEGLILSFKK